MKSDPEPNEKPPPRTCIEGRDEFKPPKSRESSQTKIHF